MRLPSIFCACELMKVLSEMTVKGSDLPGSVLLT